MTNTWSRCGTPLGPSPSLASIGAANRTNERPKAAAFLNMTFTFLFREAGIAAALRTQRGPARPAVLWCAVIAARLQSCKISVNAPALQKHSRNYGSDFPAVDLRRKSGHG